MRFAYPACKFKGLYLCHQFFYDLMSLFGAFSVNVVKLRDQENGENSLEGHHSKIPPKALHIASPTGAATIQSKGAHTEY